MDAILQASFKPKAKDYGPIEARLKLLARTNAVKTLESAKTPQGFAALRLAVDTPAKLLSANLEALVTAGLMTRRVLSDSPLRVEYQTTTAGRLALEWVGGMPQ